LTPVWRSIWLLIVGKWFCESEELKRNSQHLSQLGDVGE